MPEIISVARRILVFKNFKIVGEIDNRNGRRGGYEEISHEIGRYLA
jgi:ribose transport system ATP-binding protein